MPGAKPDAVVLHVLGATAAAGARWRRTAEANAWHNVWVSDALARGLVFAFALWRSKRAAS